jgi:putative NADH-flavin reductase
MRIAVLAASGSTGHQLAAQALDRDHSVLALPRDPAR